MKLELTRECLQKELAKYPITIVIYEALCFDDAQGQMNGAPNETEGLLVKLTKYSIAIVVYEALYFDVAQARMNGALV